METKVTLSRAHKIVERLSDMISDAIKEAMQEYEPQMSMTDFTKAPVTPPIEKVRTLVEVTQNVKNAIALANASSGVSMLMGDLSATTKLLSFYTMVQGKKKEAVGEFVQTMYQDLKTVYLRSSAPDLTQEIVELQMKKNYLSDLISEANQTKVTLGIPEDLLTLVKGFAH